MAQLAPTEATELARRVLLRAGATGLVAACVAEHLVDAELSGHVSHGLRQLPRYLASSADGTCDLAAEPRVIAESGAVSTIDAGSGLGHPALALAVDRAAAAAAAHGVGAAGVVRSGHAGRAGAWAERGVAQGAVTLVALGASDPPFWVAAAPGAAPAMHTNPLAVAVPASGSPLLLDAATSIVAEGKVMLARERGTPLPEGMIIDADLRPTTDPNALYGGGALLPSGGHKGFGLAAIVEALSISLTGADSPGRAPADGALVLCLRSDAFRPVEDVRASVDALRARVRASGRSVRVRAPGDPEAEARHAETIVVEEELLRLLREAAA